MFFICTSSNMAQLASSGQYMRIYIIQTFFHFQARNCGQVFRTCVEYEKNYVISNKEKVKLLCKCRTQDHS